MIIARSPLRISLGGGGTDLPSYYREHGGFVIAAAIDKYVYITLHETFESQFIVKYSKLEVANTVQDIRHPIIREALKLVGVESPRLEITSMSDIPAGAGLGSSGSFTTALLRALHTLHHQFVDQEELAKEACHIELDILNEPVGKQDQYIASVGGITSFEFEPDDRINVRPLRIDPQTCSDLEDNLLLFFTGYTRAASSILKDQDSRSKEKDGDMIANLNCIKELGFESKAALESGNLRCFADLMNVHWEHKKKRSNGMTNPCIDEYYEVARKNGALGGKLIGAGGGGFLMLYAENKTQLRHAMLHLGLREVRFRFDFVGTSIVTQA